MTNTMFTVGYEGRSTAELTALLNYHGVELVVDVRERPFSRKPGFSRGKLASVLEAAGIAYCHEPALGNPADNRQPFRDGDPEARERYRRVLRNGANDVMTRVVDTSRRTCVTLLCFEREHDRCHRSVVSDRAIEIDPELTIRPI